MYINLKCPECKGQGAYPNPEFFQVGYEECPADPDHYDRISSNFREWLRVREVPHGLHRKGNRYLCRGRLVGLVCHACGGSGLIPVSNLSYCSYLINRGALVV